MKRTAIQNRQKVAFTTLCNEELPELISSYSFRHPDGFKVDFSMLPIAASGNTEVDDTLLTMVKCNTVVTNENNGESVDFIVQLLDVPVYTEMGFKIKGNYEQALDLYNRATGWSFYSGETINDSTTKARASLLATRGASIEFTVDNSGALIVSYKRDSHVTKVPAGDFFRAITDLSEQDFLELFGYSNPYIVSTFSDRYITPKTAGASEGDALLKANYIKKVAAMLVPPYTLKHLSTVAEMRREINKMLFNPKYLSLGTGYHKAFDKVMSFKDRAIHQTLVETITVGDRTISAGRILTEEDLALLDAAPIDSLKIQHKNGKLYTLRKFTSFTFRALDDILLETVSVGDVTIPRNTKLDLGMLQVLNNSSLTSIKVKHNGNIMTVTRRVSADTLTIEDLYTAFSIFADNVNGYGLQENQYELTKRVVVPYTKAVLNAAAENMRVYVEALNQRISLARSAALITLHDDFSKIIRRSRILDTIFAANSVTGQMAETTNALSFDAKSYKITTNIKDGNMVSEQLTNVQDLQFGRMDAIDEPESEKIGLVHFRTLFAREDECGRLTAPYLRVANGKVLSDEPVYITADEEQDTYIAEWNETFMEEDGTPKTKVAARFNGTIITVPVSQVTYKEYTQLQNFSPVRALIPFVGNSAPKRQLMAGNHSKQAQVLPKSERPIVGTGVESLHRLGVIFAQEINQRYFDELIVINNDAKAYESEILNSTITLRHAAEQDSARELDFTIDVIPTLIREGKLPEDTSTEISISIPFMIKNSDSTLYTYKVAAVPNHVYKPTDIVAHDMGHDIREYDLELLTDYGALKTRPEDFKTALGFGTNLIVAYKTFETTTIDDAITLSSRLFYDDTLTTISMQELNIELYNTDEKSETFAKCIVSKQDLSNLDENGLPFVGTMLQTGDILCCKVVQAKDGSTEPKYRYEYVPEYKGGQVIAVTRYSDGNKQGASIILASRSGIEIGDKMSGRCGNKGVVANIVPEADMPYDPETGTSVDVILNPLGIPSRMNVSQLLEGLLAMCGKKNGKHYIISQYHKDDVKFAMSEAEKYDVHPKYLCDGRTGRMFERPVNLVAQYMQVLTHKVKKKIHAIGMNEPVDPVFLHPRRGQKNSGGQSFGEMELWCLAGVGAKAVIQEIYSTLSDDVSNREALTAKLAQQPCEVHMPEANNKNDYLYQAMARSYYVEVITDEQAKETQFKPFTDAEIRSLNLVNVVDKAALHSTDIFGAVSSLTDKSEARQKWSWIDLKAEIVPPIFVKRGVLNKLIQIRRYTKTINGEIQFATENLMEHLIAETAWLVHDDDLYPKVFSSREVLENYYGSDLPEVSTGMPALVRILRRTDTKRLLEVCEAKLHDENKPVTSKTKEELSALHNVLSTFVNGNHSLEEYIVSSYPVMPQTFRPEIKMAGRGTTPDFDHYYCNIIDKVQAYSKNQTNKAISDIYKAIAQFQGFGQTKAQQKYQNLKTWFMNSGKTHGKLRTDGLSKRMLRSGRSVITPTSISNMPFTKIGIPISMLLSAYEDQLIPFLEKQYGLVHSKKLQRAWSALFTAIGSHNYAKFAVIYEREFQRKCELTADEAYRDILHRITMFIEGEPLVPGDPSAGWKIEPQVVLTGRQPSLHKFSIRAFNPIVVHTKSMQIHPLVCGGYNADFDGDTMWWCALLTKEAKDEAMRLLSPAVDFINPKDSSLIYSFSQDITLGIYAATMLKDNNYSIYQTPEALSNIHFFRTCEELSTHIYAGVVKPYELASIKTPEGHTYLSTAGRLLFNSLIPGGFTKEKYTNNLNILSAEQMEHTSLRQLKYDGLIASKGGTTKEIHYESLAKITKEIFQENGSAAAEVYQKIVEFGFYFADTMGCSLSYEDLHWDTSDTAIEQDLVERLTTIDAELTNGVYDAKKAGNNKDTETARHAKLKAETKEKLLSRAADLRMRVEEDYQAGLVADEDKKKALTDIYRSVNEKIKGNLTSTMGRNNNMFIMYDSGARGSAGQIMQTCGCVGILQKTKTEDLETSVVHSYAEGLSSFDVQLASYSARTGVASTQNETATAGHGTRVSVYMLAGMKIVEDNCGKDDWYVDIKYKQRKDEVILRPSKEYFESRLLGHQISSGDSVMLNALAGTLGPDNTITPASFYILQKNGFTDILLSDDGMIQHIHIDVESIQGATLTVENPYLREFLQNGKLTRKCASIIEKNTIKRLGTSYGEFQFFYEMEKVSSSMLLGRECADTLPYTETAFYEHEELGSSVHKAEAVTVVTSRTIAAIERAGLERVPVRIALDCKSKGGICRHCYGLKYSNHKFPKVGESVGYEAAQSLGEPAAQMTISLFHSGGAAGASVANGVETCQRMFEGRMPEESSGSDIPSMDDSRRGSEALLAPFSGYVAIHRIDSTSRVSIKPASKSCERCQRCLSYQAPTASTAYTVSLCPVENNNHGLCTISKNVDNKKLIVTDGEYVKLGQPLTYGYTIPNTLPNRVSEISTKELFRLKQMMWLCNYFSTFEGSSILINARHFELLTRAQTINMSVISSDSPEFEIGRYYEYGEVVDHMENLELSMKVLGARKVAPLVSGALAGTTFEDSINLLACCATTYTKDFNKSELGSVISGYNLQTDKPRVFLRPKVITQDARVTTNESNNVNMELTTQEFFDRYSAVVEVPKEEDSVIDLTQIDFGDAIDTLDLFSQSDKAQEAEDMQDSTSNEAPSASEDRLETMHLFSTADIDEYDIDGTQAGEQDASELQNTEDSVVQDSEKTKKLGSLNLF